MALDVEESLMEEAREFFRVGKYDSAEPILNQMILQGQKSAEVFHMLGTILYDRGRFNKAIRAFRRALELNPGFTDASIGLSIILNDLGKYEEGRKVFEEAQAMLAKDDNSQDRSMNEKLASKHDELAELYFQYGRFTEALEQYYKSLNLSSRSTEITMNIAECYLKMGDTRRGVKLLRELISDQPAFMGSRIRLGKFYLDSERIPEAIEEWERVLARDPENRTAQDLIDTANRMDTTRIQEDQYGELEG